MPTPPLLRQLLGLGLVAAAALAHAQAPQPNQEDGSSMPSPSLRLRGQHPPLQRALGEGSGGRGGGGGVVTGLPDSRRGDPNVATGTTSDPPRRVYDDRAHVEWVTNQEWLVPWLGAYDAGLFANAVVADRLPQCQWHARLDWNGTRQGLLDRYAMYFVQLIEPLDNDTVWRVTGDYFPVMYFSYQLYDQANDQTAEVVWADHSIKPMWGKNPFKEVATPQEAGAYQIHFTRTGDHGLPNELAGPVNNLGLLVLRLYKPVPSEPLPLDLAIVPPKIQKGKLSDLAHSFTTEWPACSAHTRPIADFQESWYEYLADTLDGGEGRVDRLAGDCPIPLGTRGMTIFDQSSSDASTQGFLIARNNNSPYLFYCVDSVRLRAKGLDEHNVVLKIKGKLPPIPYGLYDGEPPELVPNKHNYDVRYASFVTVKPLPPFSQYEGIDGQLITETYRQRFGDSWDGSYSLVVSTDPSAPQRCRLMDGEKDIFLGFRQIDGQGAKNPRMRSKPFNPSIVYRQLVGRKDGKTAKHALEACHAAKRCNDTGLIQSIMQEYYPVVEYYICHTDGRVESPPAEDYVPEQDNNSRATIMPKGGIVGNALGGM